MKTLVIPDLHGKDIWKDMVASDDFTEIVFLGDYVDCFGLSHITQLESEKKRLQGILSKEKDDSYKVYYLRQIENAQRQLDFVNRNFVSDESIVQNLRDIIWFKKANASKVTLLMGNHDVVYLKKFVHFTCSGHNMALEGMLTPIFTDNKDLFQAAHHSQDDILLTHGGVNSLYLEKYEYSTRPTEIANKLNEEFKNYDENPHIFLSGDFRPGPFWQRPDSLTYAQPQGFWQIVGHTGFKEVTFDLRNKICYADCLNSQNQFVVIYNDNIGIRNL